MRWLTFVLMSWILVGCGPFERWLAGMTGGLSYRCAKSGVEYVQTEVGSIVVLVDADGRPVKCTP